MPIRDGRLVCDRGHDLGDAGDPYRDPDCAECRKDELEQELFDEMDQSQAESMLSICSFPRCGRAKDAWVHTNEGAQRGLNTLLAHSFRYSE